MPMADKIQKRQGTCRLRYLWSILKEHCTVFKRNKNIRKASAEPSVSPNFVVSRSLNKMGKPFPLDTISFDCKNLLSIFGYNPGWVMNLNNVLQNVTADLCNVNWKKK